MRWNRNDLSQPEDTSRRPAAQVSDSPTENLPTENLGASTQHNRPLAEASNGSSGDSRRKTRQGRDPQLMAAQSETRRLARTHYENFLVASVLLPRRLHQPFFNVYAFCRTADDLADESGTAELALQRLGQFQRNLDAAFEGRPTEGLFLALADTIEQFQLNQQPFDDLLDAFRQDQQTSRYATFADVLDYCRRSANPVGRIVLALAGCADDDRATLSDSICTGLQLANFLQDVAGDFRRGRIYLPADEMSRFGVDESMLREAQSPRPLRQWLASECERAEGYLRRGLPLADRVPRWFAGDVRLFAHGGLATLDAIRRIDFDVLRIRPTVSKRTQMVLLARAALRLL